MGSYWERLFDTLKGFLKPICLVLLINPDGNGGPS